MAQDPQADHGGAGSGPIIGRARIGARQISASARTAAGTVTGAIHPLPGYVTRRSTSPTSCASRSWSRAANSRSSSSKLVTGGEDHASLSGTSRFHVSSTRRCREGFATRITRRRRRPGCSRASSSSVNRMLSPVLVERFSAIILAGGRSAAWRPTWATNASASGHPRSAVPAPMPPVKMTRSAWPSLNRSAQRSAIRRSKCPNPIMASHSLGTSSEGASHLRSSNAAARRDAWEIEGLSSEFIAGRHASSGQDDAISKQVRKRSERCDAVPPVRLNGADSDG